MTAFGWMSIITTVLLGWLAGFTMGRAMEGAAINWTMFAWAALPALLVYGLAIVGRRRRPSPYARYKKSRK
jgi:hypothetical protein